MNMNDFVIYFDVRSDLAVCGDPDWLELEDAETYDRDAVLGDGTLFSSTEVSLAMDRMVALTLMQLVDVGAEHGWDVEQFTPMAHDAQTSLIRSHEDDVQVRIRDEIDRRTETVWYSIVGVTGSDLRSDMNMIGVK